jgi:hypothetical protein
VRQRDYCRWHLSHIGRRMMAARARSRHQPLPLKLPLLEDPLAVQVALMQVLDAIASNDIDVQRGRALLSGLRFASSNLKAVRAWKQEKPQDPQPLFAHSDNHDAEWPSFEQEHDLPKNFDLSVAPEVAFPPPPEPQPVDDSPLRARIRQALGDAQMPIPGSRLEVTADDMEMFETYEREGEEAGRKRSAELQRNRQRRHRRMERARYEVLARNRNIQFAARQLLLDPKGRAEIEAMIDRQGLRREADAAAQACAAAHQAGASDVGHAGASVVAGSASSFVQPAAADDRARKGPQSQAAADGVKTAKAAPGRA